MTISDVTYTKQITLYPLSKPSLDTGVTLWVDPDEEESIQPLLTIGRALNFKDEIEDDTIRILIS